MANIAPYWLATGTASLLTNRTSGWLAAPVTQTTTTAVPLQASFSNRDTNICFLIKKHLSLQKHYNRD
jgi:hypothetical protein